MINAIGIIISIILIVILANPGWLPFSEETITKIRDLQTNHFLIERSGRITVAHIATLILAIAIIWLVYQVLSLILKFYGEKGAHSRTISILLSGLFRYLAIIIAFIWGLSILGVDTTAVLAGAGIIGLIIGFGAQSLIEDIITGLFIIFERQYEVGDIIVIDDFRGIVRSIGVRTTSLEDAGGNIKVVNNSDIRNFQNRSRVTSLALADVSVSYGTDIRKLEQLLRDHLPEMYEPNKDLYLGAPVLMGVQDLADSGVVIRLSVDCDEENIFRAQRRLRRDIKVLFDDFGVEIPFPQVVVHQGD